MSQVVRLRKSAPGFSLHKRQRELRLRQNGGDGCSEGASRGSNPKNDAFENLTEVKKSSIFVRCRCAATLARLSLRTKDAFPSNSFQENAS